MWPMIIAGVAPGRSTRQPPAEVTNFIGRGRTVAAGDLGSAVERIANAPRGPGDGQISIQSRPGNLLDGVRCAVAARLVAAQGEGRTVGWAGHAPLIPSADSRLVSQGLGSEA